MLAALPTDARQVFDWPFSKFEPYYAELQAVELTSANLDAFLRAWSRLYRLVYEGYTRQYVAMTCDTNNADIETRLNRYLEEVYTQAMAAEQTLKEKLLASGLQPAGFEIPLRNMRAEAELFRQENLPLLAEAQKTGMEYDKIVGGQTVLWNGEEKTVAQMRPVFQERQRATRQKAWELSAGRQLQDRESLNELWVRLFSLRRKIAANAGKPSYREYRWQEFLRFDYTPEDCASFRNAIEQAVVPAARRIYEKRRARLGLDSLRPWDLDVETTERDPLRPFQKMEDYLSTGQAIFEQVDPVLGGYFTQMRQEGLIDPDNRKGKAPGAYCIDYPLSERPFIFLNAVGLHDDVQTLLHECGHAFHVFESVHLPYAQQTAVPMEFAEVASMGMELIAAPYLPKEAGGYYTQAEAARARIEHLESLLLFWPYMAVVDGFQHWAYTHQDEALDPRNLDAAWDDLWQRFMQGIDYSGYEDVRRTGWQRKLHIFQQPFYYVDYGLAQLGAVQVWNNALKDQAAAVAAYRKALALGGTAGLPELFSTAGARFAFDVATLQEATSLITRTLDELEEKV